MPEDLHTVVRQRGSEGAGPAAGRARTHPAQDAGHGISLARRDLRGFGVSWDGTGTGSVIIGVLYAL